jgi:hypothetical protein
MIAGNLAAFHELAFVGATQQRTFTGASANLQLIASPVTRHTFLIRSNQNVRIRQGGSLVTAAVTDMLLTANTYLKVTVTSTDNNYIAAITPTGGTDGTLDSTILSDQTP